MVEGDTPHKRAWIGWAAGGAILLAAVFLWRAQDGAGGIGEDTARAWFTSDNGKTWFADDAAKAAPFEYKGKIAVRCYVFTCDGGATKFAGYLERYRADVKRQLDNGAGGLEPGAAVTGVEVKRPRDSVWVPRTAPQAAAIMRPRCDNGSRPQAVLP